MAKTLDKHRAKDEALGITPGVRLGPKNLLKEDEKAPDITELGLPSYIRRELETLVPKHLEFGQIEREAAGERKTITDRIKGLWEEIGDDVRSFYCATAKVTRSVSRRPKLNETKLRLALLRLKVKQNVIDEAWAEAQDMQEVVTLRISPPGEE